MATARSPRKVIYPTSDGRPMAETERHRDLMMALIRSLQRYYAADENVCVSGNMLMYYVEGDKRRHVSPDVFVTLGIPRKERDYYLLWEEGKAPDLVIELTSSSTRSEDTKKKFALYRDVLAVAEYILFDPYGDYLKPPLQGYRLVDGEYVAIEPVAGRLPSEVLGLLLERNGADLRLVDPRTGDRLLTDPEIELAWHRDRAAKAQAEAAKAQAEAAKAQAEAAKAQAEAAHHREQAARIQADEARQLADNARLAAERENGRLRRQVEALQAAAKRRQKPD